MASLDTPSASYNIRLMVQDMAAKGFIQKDLAEHARVSAMVVSRFLSGERQNARAAKKIANALGYSVRRYLISSTEAVAS